MSYSVTWDAGATAEIEFISPEGDGNYQLRYNPPYRTTLRSPVDTLRVGPQELRPSLDKLQRFAESIHLIDGRGRAAPGADAAQEPVKQLERIGQELFEFMLPRHVRSDLDDETFIELALDEQLTPLPWEVMFDGDGFLSHKHALGRFITLRTPLPADTRRRRLPSQLDELKVLIVGVSRPTPPEDGEAYEELGAVHPEVTGIVETLADVGVQPTVLLDDDATYDNVREALRQPYHIVHYTGHAAFDEERPHGSALLLFDEPLTTGALMVSFSEHPALLCFVNGCETSRPEQNDDGGDEPQVTWETRYNNYGLARSFLETGTYLLGSRWRLEDNAAQTFAKSFYEHLLGEGKPVGKAICAARRATAQDDDLHCAWASYIYYGDPRIGIQRLHGGPPDGLAPGVGDEPPQPAPEGRPAQQVAPPDVADLEALADEYHATRADMDSGLARTRQMTEIARRASRLAEERGVTPALSEVYDSSDGGRVIALAQMRSRPAAGHLPMVVTSIAESRSAFEQYVALEVAVGLVDLLDAQQVETLRAALEDVSEREDFYGTDRFAIAAEILTRLAHQSGDADAVALA